MYINTLCLTKHLFLPIFLSQLPMFFTTFPYLSMFYVQGFQHKACQSRLFLLRSRSSAQKQFINSVALNFFSSDLLIFQNKEVRMANRVDFRDPREFTYIFSPLYSAHPKKFQFLLEFFALLANLNKVSIISLFNRNILTHLRNYY